MLGDKKIMPATWDPRIIMQLMVITTGCLCLVVLVVGTLYFISVNKMPIELLGSTTGVGIGGGLSLFASIIYLVIKAGLGR